MKYQNIVSGVFLERPNRFLAYVQLEKNFVVCHVKNTGRCQELLIPGAKVVLEYHPGALEAGRKTEYSLIGVYKGNVLINMDSQAPNAVAAEWLQNGGFTREMGLNVENIKKEVTYGESRFDLAFHIDGKPAFMEVKGVTLEEEHIAKFPDAPTPRGVKHLLELGRAVACGYEAYVLFVIQMKGIWEFTPNMKTHPLFGETLQQVKKQGVHILAFDCMVREDELVLENPVPVRL